MGASKSFPGMLGSIDCMHWKWKHCPTALHGQFKGKGKDATIILEAVASNDLWIWHSYFGLPESNNDLNVLQRSNLLARLSVGEAPPVNFEINGRQYNMGYYLADEIYAAWATLVKTISNPQGNQNTHFARRQEACRKDVEREFGVLQARFAIVRGPACFWHQKDLWRIMTTCVILHNMIIENEREQPPDYRYENEGNKIYIPPVQPQRDEWQLQKFLEMHRRIEDRAGHEQLRDDLVEHLWALHGQ